MELDTSWHLNCQDVMTFRVAGKVSIEAHMNAEDLEYSVLGYFWHIKNGRAISIHEKKGLDEKIGFIAFGYLVR
jgi:hypothetical protein